MVKPAQRIVAISTLLLLTVYMLGRTSFGRTRKEALQKRIDLLEKLISQMEEMTEKKEKLMALRDELQNIKDSISDTSGMDMFYVQQLMDAHSRLEQMITDIMKAVSETQSAIAANLKS